MNKKATPVVKTNVPPDQFPSNLEYITTIAPATIPPIMLKKKINR